jgi:aldose 1-epimerase
MRFSIRRVQEKGLSLINVKDEKGGTEISLLPAYGATLHAFRIPLRTRDRAPHAAAQPAYSAHSASHAAGAGHSADTNGLFNIIDNYSGLEEVEKDMGDSFKGPKLSPFPCRIAGGKYRYEGQEYGFGHLFKDGNAIHGLLYDKPFIVTNESTGESSASVSLQHDYKGEDPAYPFEYRCLVKYILHSGNLLEVQTTLTNLDKRTIPIADGWHPYFRLGGKIDDWWMQFNAAAIVEFNKELIPTGRLLKYDAFKRSRLVGHTQLDNCFVLEDGKTNPACELFNPATGLRISFCTDERYPYLQLYTPSGRESIAVENLSAAPDCFNNRMGLLLLPPGDSQNFTVNYKVSIG